MHKKNNKQYYFSTEGETEQWYLEHLAKLINNNSQSCNTVSFKIKKAQPISYVKQLSVISLTTIYHLFDFEAYEQSDIKHFEKVIEDMKKIRINWEENKLQKWIYKFNFRVMAHSSQDGL